MPLEPFCGSEFWDWHLSWYTDKPDLTPCVQDTLLVWVPCGLLAALSILEFLYYRRVPQAHIPVTLLQLMKMFSILVLVIVSVVQMVESSGPPVNVYTPIVRLCAFLLAGYLNVYIRHRGAVTSPTLFFFWLLMTFADGVKFRSILLHVFGAEYRRDVSTLDFVTTMISFPFVFGQFFLTCFAEANLYGLGQRKEKFVNPSPEWSASFLNKLLFWWFNEMAKLGYKRPLRAEDMYSLNEDNKTTGIVKYFDVNWDAEKEKRGCVLTKAVDEDGKPIFESQVSLLGPLFKTFAGSIFTVAFFKFISAMLAFVNPQILDYLIGFVTSDEPQWHGVFYAVLMLLAAIAESLLNNQYEYRLFTLAMRIRAALISAIYRKALTLSSVGKGQFTTGEITNLMAVDTQRIMDYVHIANMLWAAPLQIGVAIYFLWQQLGVATVGGIVIMVLLLPTNGIITVFIRKYQVQLMKFKDRRIKLMNEILAGIKVLKLYAWEKSFMNRITEWRNEEITSLRKQAYLFGAVVFAFSSAPFLVALASFATFVLIDSNNVLDANKAFVSLTLFNIMRMPMAFLPMLLTFTATFFVSLSRLNKFLRMSDLDPNAVQHVSDSDDAILIEDATFAWSERGEPVLKDINLRIPRGSLVAVVGTVGTGKSSLVSALLGELTKQSGRVNVSGSVAYVPQQAWIQNATIRENILFGQRFERSHYEFVLDNCALRDDLKILQGGDLTEVGEKGINLSGGQKQRISMARAAYSNSDIYYLDDPLSAVDSHVGKHIFEKVIGHKGMLAGKTRILVTHRLSVLPDVDCIYVIKDGHISEAGSYAELVARRGAFSEFLLQFLQGSDETGVLGLEEEDLKVMEDIAQQAGAPPELIRQLSRVSGSDSDTARISDRDRSSSGLRRRKGSSSITRTGSVSSIKSDNKKEDKAAKSRLTEDETAAVGSVKWSVYWQYAKAMGAVATLLTLLSFLVANGFNMATSLWLSSWSNDALDPRLNNDVSQRNYRLGIYALFGILETIFTLWGSISLNLDVLRGSKVLHENMLNSVMRAPMSFFDTTPMGRVLNRFSKDIDTADITMRMNLRQLFSQFFRTFVSLVLISMETPIFLLLALPLAVCYYFVQKYYIATSRQLKRIESIQRSPIYVHFSETVTGASSIRAYNASSKFINKSNQLTDTNHTSYHPSLASARWLAVRLEFLGYCIVFISAMLAVFTRETLSPGIAGLSVSYAMTITMNLNMLVRASSDVETNFVSIERCLEYSHTPVEAEWNIPQNKPPTGWPTRGAIVFDRYSTRYRSELPLVVKDVTCKLEPGEKVGVVGRTGAGKSSLTLALFRIIEAASGSIIIDDINISILGLHDLRSRLTIIPQDPVLFSGTLRMNLDPFSAFKDDELWKALEQAHLKDYVVGLSDGLDYNITEGGDNLSVGQRQLVCLARALLRKTQILILDEATAAVDMETDALIQNTIRQEFNDCTILTIAHRLNTIMDYDRVMVLDQGKVMEYDTPQALLQDAKTIFYSLAKDAELV